jgi:hypothetical protein
MIKYLVFKNDPSGGKFSAPGSPEDIACDIARVVEMDGNSKYSFIAYAENSSEATFAAIKSLPRFSVELDQAKINTWITDAEPMLRSIFFTHESIDEAYSTIRVAIDKLIKDQDKSIVCQDFDVLGECDLDRAFDALIRPNEYLYAEHIAEYFGVQVFENQIEG